MCVTALKGGAGPTGGALCPWFLLCVFGSFLLQAVTETVDKKMITFPGPHHDLIHISVRLGRLQENKLCPRAVL